MEIPADATLDAVTLEVIRNALPAIANEMAADLQRTSYNMMIYEVRDFCTALVDPEGQLISQNVGGVSHFVADLGVLVTDGMKRYGRNGFKPGDVIITNHQAVAGQHLNNVVIYMPHFHRGELLLFAMVRAHWIDVGGMSTGFGAGPTAADPWMEGLQLDQLKICEGGKLNEALYRVLKDNIRFPESSLGDMKSQMAACRLAARRVDELFDKYGKDTIFKAIARIFAETEAKCRNVVSGLADGIYEAEAAIDDDGLKRDEPVRVHARVTIAGSAMTIDLSGCSGERRAAIRLGIDVRVRNLVEGKWNFEQTRRNCPPHGLWGGKPGAYGDYLLRLPGETAYKSMAASHHPVPARSEVIVRTGGGGWGDPLARDPQAVRSDVIEEFISAASAREDYGVVLRDDLSVDLAATMRLRESLRVASGRAG